MTVEQLAEHRAAIAEAFSAPGRHRARNAAEPTDLGHEAAPIVTAQIVGDLL